MNFGKQKKIQEHRHHYGSYRGAFSLLLEKSAINLKFADLSMIMTVVYIRPVRVVVGC